METHVIVGAGQVGSATALLLAQSDRRVLLVSRSGSGPDHPNIERVAADGAERATMLRIVTDSEPDTIRRFEEIRAAYRDRFAQDSVGLVIAEGCASF